MTLRASLLRELENKNLSVERRAHVSCELAKDFEYKGEYERDTPMSATPYLKNAWAKKDGDGVYWLFIQGGDLKAMFRLMLDDDSEDSIPRRALDAWLAEQDSTNGKAKQRDAF